MANLENVKLETIPTITASMSNASYQGADGAPGVGVPTGGTAGQVLAKVSDTDYDTEWVDQTGGGGSSTPGEDGGYYQPNVDTSGNLTWTASKDDMPAVAGSNIMGPKGDTGPQGPAGKDGEKGETGDSGVYIGQTEPTDPDVNVWIDPNGQPSAVPASSVSFDDTTAQTGASNVQDAIDYLVEKFNSLVDGNEVSY